MRKTLPTWMKAMAGAGIGIAGLAGSAAALAQDTPAPSGKKVTYSPYPAKNFPNRVYFGDTHLHTSYSTDAGMIGGAAGLQALDRFIERAAIEAPRLRRLFFLRIVPACSPSRCFSRETISVSAP